MVVDNGQTLDNGQTVPATARDPCVTYQYNNSMHVLFIHIKPYILLDLRKLSRFIG